MSSFIRSLFTGHSKHKKLPEGWATLREPVMEGITFYCKYLGSTLVDDPRGEVSTAEAIKRIIHTAKQRTRKPERVALYVSLQGIKMEDCVTKEVMLEISIHKISYCSADAHYDHVFGFISTTDNDTYECHAFLCPKRKMAQEVTISIAQSFNLAYECWKMSLNKISTEDFEGHDGIRETFGHEELPAEVTVGSIPMSTLGSVRGSQSQPSSQASSPIPIRSDFGSSDMSTSGYQSSSQGLLIDLEDSTEKSAFTSSKRQQQQQGKAVGAFSKPMNTLEDLDSINDGFSRLAIRRGSHPHPIPTTPGKKHLGVSPAELGHAATALTDHQTGFPTESGYLPSNNRHPHPASSPIPASRAPHTSHAEEACEILSHSPNTAFLHSCLSPPSSSFMYSSNRDFHSPPLPPPPPQSPTSPRCSSSTMFQRSNDLYFPPIPPAQTVQASHPLPVPQQTAQATQIFHMQQPSQPTQTPHMPSHPQTIQSPNSSLSNASYNFPFSHYCHKDIFSSTRKSSNNRNYYNTTSKSLPPSPLSVSPNATNSNSTNRTPSENSVLTTTNLTSMITTTTNNPFLPVSAPLMSSNNEMPSGSYRVDVELPKVVVSTVTNGCPPRQVCPQDS